MFARIGLIFLLAVFVGHPASGQSLQISMGISAPPRTSVWRGSEAYRDTVNKQLDGLARIELLPVSSSELIPAVKSGQIQMAVVSSSALTSKAPQLALLELPFFFRDQREVAAMQDSLVGEVMLASVNEDGLVGLAFWNSGMSQLFGKISIESAEQFKGLKFRTTVSREAQVAARELGAQPVFLPGGELFAALQVGAVDLVELPPRYVAERVVPLEAMNHTDLNYRPVVSMIVANAKFWRSARLRVQSTLVDQARSIAEGLNGAALESQKSVTAQLENLRFKTVSISTAQFESFARAAEPGWYRVEQIRANGFLAGALDAREELRRLNYDVPARRRSDATPPGPKTSIGFATDRRDDKDHDVAKRYSAARGALTFGHGVVAMDPNRPFGTGDIDHVKLVDIAERPRPADFIAAVKQQLQQSEREEILLYVHGFRTLFSEAIEGAAQIAADTRFQGATVVFSWPSDGTTSGYSSDGEDIDDSRDNFIKVLKMLSQDIAPAKLHVLTHSMGGRLPAASFELLAGRPQSERPKLHHLVLAAADVRINQFERAVPGILSISKKATIYASEWDQALRCSMWLNSNPRVGQGGSNIVIVPNIDTIDVSAVERPWLLSPGRIPCTPFGHSHTSRNPAVLADLYDLIANDTPAKNRQRLREEINGNSQKYWSLR